MKSVSPAYQKMIAVLDRLEQDQTLCVPENFIARMQAMDALEIHLLDNAMQTDNETEYLAQRLAALKQTLDTANERLFAQLLAAIRSNNLGTLRQYIGSAERQISLSADDDNLGYDELDMLVNGLLEVDFVPEDPESRHPDMVFYQPTPARIILTLIRQLQPTADDVFYDLGSGLGHVPILVHLLTGIKTTGVELEESYFRYSNECLKKLDLSDIVFINADARDADYADGTIFYLYTPFQGEIMRQVLAKLEAQSKRRPIRICTYGPCTAQVGKQTWLQPLYQTGKHEGSLAIFRST